MTNSARHFFGGPKWTICSILELTEGEKSGHRPGILGIEISVIKVNTLATSGCGGARLHRIFWKINENSQ